MAWCEERRGSVKNDCSHLFTTNNKCLRCTSVLMCYNLRRCPISSKLIDIMSNAQFASSQVSPSVIVTHH